MLNNAVAIMENKICGGKFIPSIRLVWMTGGGQERGGSFRRERYSGLR